MVDIDQLLVGLLTELNVAADEALSILSPLQLATPFEINANPLSALAGKFFFGMDTSNIPKPYGRVGVLSGSVENAYGAAKAADHCLMQIDIFATNLSQANALLKSACDAVANKVFPINGQAMVHCIRRNFGVLAEGKETQNVVYHAFHVFEVLVDN